MLTIFALPKPFREHTSIVQRNAIGSWLQSCPSCEVLLLGEDEGVVEASSAFGVRHVSKVRRSKFGTPLVSSIFEIAEREAKYDLLCYVNSDIILMSDFFKAIEKVTRLKQKFLMIGRRWNVEVPTLLDLCDSHWEEKLRLLAIQKGVIETPRGLDYFVFRRGFGQSLPDFAIGRPYYDNWLVYRARASGCIVIDASQAVMAIHQKHDYSHISKKIPGENRLVLYTQRIFSGVYGPEAIQNFKLTGGTKHLCTTFDATHVLTPLSLKSFPFKRYVGRIYYSWSVRYPLLGNLRRRMRRLTKHLFLWRLIYVWFEKRIKVL